MSVLVPTGQRPVLRCQNCTTCRMRGMDLSDCSAASWLGVSSLHSLEDVSEVSISYAEVGPQKELSIIPIYM